MSSLSTHILDTALGKPASGVALRLEQQTAQGWETLCEALTDADGRYNAFTQAPLSAGRYRLTAEIGLYFAQTLRETLYPTAQIDFVVAAGGGHYHLPFLISPWSWSTYRGS
ncbi:hydroxyisourate hydrolase [Franconibacter pulveris 1160]|uniref:5-hydroxyisourate hydrolase n=2 Tax=Franconibacter TaxID=1649295 RepID=A0A0J8VTB3_9ENTR|nr:MULTISPECIES: hydroxyisourate hydrolase [Franconibacter]KMV36446.1 5-hydroxyisourate hydrolase [Franconibacter pulveris]MCK1966795.1 hydroxyisourate hydrolase [Franconibacter sp. IITDAS19]MEB5921729.1 hydroxyisourate hydrolase [Franconibacter daqui]GGD06520.1 5-hydroxyisourate hydrolase [Franconibacter daqui]